MSITRVPVALSAALLLLSTFVLSACPPPEPPNETTVGDLTVTLDGTRLQVTDGTRDLLDLDSTQVGFRTADAVYDMQFGMFKIEEFVDEPWDTADAARVASVDGGKMRVELLQGDDILAAVVVEAGGSGREARHLIVSLEPTEVGLNRAQIAFACAPDDHFAGLGAQTHDVDHRGERVPLWVSEQGVGKFDDDEYREVWQVVGRKHATHIPVPAVVTSRSTAFALETTAYSVFDLCFDDADDALGEDVVRLEAWEAAPRFHLFVGDDPVDALSLLSDFQGRTELPAPWLHAPWNDAIFGSENVRRFAQFLKDEEIPSSAIWSEDWRGGQSFGGGLYRLDEDWGLDREVYPDFEDVVSDLNHDGIHMQVYFNTFLYDGADVFEEAIENGYAVLDRNGEPYIFDGASADFGESAILDLTNPDAVEFVKDHLRAAIDLGAGGWMADFAEWMPVTRAVVHSGEDPALVHNRYAVDWQRVNYEVLQEKGVTDRAIVYARSGHLFSPGVTQVVWAGDQRTSFDDDDGLPTIVPIGLGLSSVGYLFYAHDIAGYQSSTNDPATKELFFRWTELGAFSPVMRTHHGTHTTANWNLESDAETTALWKRYAQLHIRLVPYTRGLAVRAVADGIPLWLPLGLLHPDDENVWPLMDELYFGDALLVAPVVTEGATSRDVVFPEGRFVRVFNQSAPDGDAIVGPTTVNVAAPMDEIPVFIRAGGIVPLTANTPDTLLPSSMLADGSTLEALESIEGDRVVIVGLGADGTFTEESGASYTLDGDGTSTGGLTLDDEGAVTISGNGSVEGDGFTLTLAGHPDGRTTRVFFK